MRSNNSQHIFFVDDEASVRQIVGDTLQQVSSKVSCFASAADCLKRMNSQKCDLLITDLRMLEMDGIELARRTRLLTPWIPVLIMTGYGDIPTAVGGH
jgi:DNA-binding NtrC family response regulator